MAVVGAILIGLLGLNLLIIVHELGHFLAARKNGVEVEEFGLGFPPRLAGRRLGRGFWRCYYSINWLPIGGFVRLKGEDGGQSGPGSYAAASLRARLEILLAGVAVNFLVGLGLLTLLAAVGLPRLLPAEPFFADRQPWTDAVDGSVSQRQLRLAWVEPGSAAASAGLRPGDRLVGIDGRALASQRHWQAELASRAGRTVELTISRRRTSQSITVPLAASPYQLAGDGYLDTDSSELAIEAYGRSAPLAGLLATVQYSQLTVEGAGLALSSLVGGSPETAREVFRGPVGIFQAIKLTVEQSWLMVILILALMSLSLAVMNLLLPLPALDGPRALIAVWCEKVRRRPLSPATEKRLQQVCLVVILALLVLITVFADVPRLWNSS